MNAKLKMFMVVPVVLAAIAASGMAVSAGSDPGARGETAAGITIPAHSHNDYYRDNPLFEALAVGASSIEVDVFPVDGRLMVAHDRHEIRAHRTIEAMYLDPLRRRFERFGSVYSGQRSTEPVILLVDFKGDGVESLGLLEDALEPLRPWLYRVEEGVMIEGQLSVIVSGRSPRALIAEADDRLLFADGRLPDLVATGGLGPRVAPLVSGRWQDQFSWDGRGEFPERERQRLGELIRAAESRGQMLRLWAAPDTPKAWETLLNAGVHLVNTDRPLQFGVWYSRRVSGG